METNKQDKFIKNERDIDNIINDAMQNLKKIVDTNVVFGNPIYVDDKVIIPVTKINVGFVAGGGELNTKYKKASNLPFAGGSGSGFNVTPVGIITIIGDKVDYTCIESIKATSELINLTNKIFNSVMDSIKGANNEK